MKVRLPKEDDPELDVAPLIDMVFLLLVFFMVSARLVKSEGDLGIRLPGMVQAAETVDMPDEQMIEVQKEGRVFLNGREYDSAFEQELPELYTTLLRYKQSSDSNKNKAMITIAAHDDAKHQRVIDVMNACAAAGIKNVTFSASGL
jgi:biopolymer transport protein ExbD